MESSRYNHILVVDDEAELMEALCELLAEYGYEPAGFTGSKEALRELREREFDILLADLMMPDGDGISLLRAALEVSPHLVGIIMTGQGTVQTAVDAMKVGAFDYLQKPFRVGALLPILARAVEVRRLRLENAQLHESLAVYELSNAVASTLDVETILAKTADAAVEQCRADEVSIMLPSPDGQELRIAVVRGEGRSGLVGQRVPLSQGIAGWVARHGEPLLLHDRVDDSRFAPIRPREDVKTAVSMPMMAGGRVAGVLNVNATRAGRRFTAGTIKTLNILVSIAASALEGARRYQQAREAEQKYRSIFDNALEGIFQATPEGRFLAANPALAHMLGYESPEELLEKVGNIESAYLEPKRRAALVQAMAAKGEVRDFEFEARRRDGSVISVRENVRAVKNAEGQDLLYEGICEDITERKSLEGELRQVQKMEALGQLAGGIAHDFNNMLMPIMTYSTLMLERLPAGDPLRRHADIIANAAERAAALPRQLLTFSRRQMLEPRVLDLNHVVLEFQKVLRRVIGENIDLALVTAPDPGRVRADVGQMEQVVMNLVVNARDAMPSGGTIAIETAAVRLDEEYARLRPGVTPGPYVMLAVTDTGCGMDSATQGRIFEPFFTTKAEGKGTGLGLATVYGIVQQSGGHIRVDTEVGRGTEFRVYLPRVDAPASQSADRAAAALSLAGSETLLVVEDDAVVREAACAVLERCGYTVLQAADAEAALGLARERTAPIHLLVTDVVMPGMNGRELAERLVSLRPETKVLFMSGYAEQAVVGHGVLQAGAAFLQKPFGPVVLMWKVREVLDADPS
ncbi:MAG: response regulator [Armatimonadetes bacterium]|nr:response regulator [Armatimonadota bacterium]